MDIPSVSKIQSGNLIRRTVTLFQNMIDPTVVVNLIRRTVTLFQNMIDPTVVVNLIRRTVTRILSMS